MSALAQRLNDHQELAQLSIRADRAVERDALAPTMSTPAIVLVVAVVTFGAGYAAAAGTGPHPQ
ncbi:hypothetical protein ACFW1A_26570 [Kitasatospora sp. NPDC058965]|uniref:hypothetical protein n=1 Tax=Kitasatospora sp. NPDC058965 TaxID=3346682 RepID=UPI0036C4C2E4